MSDDDVRHYGVKGMHWGIRKERDVVGREKASVNPQAAVKANQIAKAYVAEVQRMRGAKKPLTKRQQAKNRAEAETKFANKFVEPGTESKKGLSPAQKKLLIGTAVGVGVIGGAYLLSRPGVTQKINQFAADQFSGKPIDKNVFNMMVDRSKKATWNEWDYIKGDALTREGFELPAGHVFHRISTTAENTFSEIGGETLGTYSTHSIDDFNRYVVGFRGEKGTGVDLHHITWTATKPVKVPDLPTVLDTLHEIMEGPYKGSIPREDVIRNYNALSGGAWTGGRGPDLFRALSEKGYSAIVDEMDAGVIGETPLVYFGKDHSTKQSVAFTKDTIKEAEKALIEIKNRKV